MIRKQQRYSIHRDPTDGAGPARFTTNEWFAAVIAAGVGAAGSIASGAMAADAAEGAAGLQKEYLDLGINEIRGALDPSMDRLDAAQAWSDRLLRNQFRNSMRSTRPYADAGARGLSRLNYLMGTDTGLGHRPTAPTAPKPPKYSKDPAQAAVQKKAYQKALRVYDRAKAKFATDSAAWDSASKAQASDPNFGSLMRPYQDRYEGRIDEVAGRKYEDKHGYTQKILDTAAEKYNDKYADRILAVASDKFGKDDFEDDFGYQFRRDEGTRGVEQSAAARGSVLSGGTLKELTRFNQGLASDEVDRAHGRWADQHNRHGAALEGQQAFDYNAWDKNKATRLDALGGERAFDYGVFGDQKNTELGSLVDRRNFDFGAWGDNRDFQYGALNNMVGIGQDATDDQNQLRQFWGGLRSGNRIANAVQQGNWQQNAANNIAEFLAGQGNAQAAGEVGSANAWSNAFQGVGNLAAYYYGANGRNNIGNGQRRWAPSAPEWWKQNRGVPT
jgi:hypothetical protein